MNATPPPPFKVTRLGTPWFAQTQTPVNGQCVQDQPVQQDGDDRRMSRNTTEMDKSSTEQDGEGHRQTTIWHVMWSNGIMTMMPGTRPLTWSTSITTMTLTTLTVTMNPTPATVRTALHPSQTMLTMMSHPMVQGAYPAKLSN